jgi:hypothetical protein
MRRRPGIVLNKLQTIPDQRRTAPRRRRYALRASGMT